MQSALLVFNFSHILLLAMWVSILRKSPLIVVLFEIFIEHLVNIVKKVSPYAYKTAMKVLSYIPKLETDEFEEECNLEIEEEFEDDSEAINTKISRMSI